MSEISNNNLYDHASGYAGFKTAENQQYVRADNTGVYVGTDYPTKNFQWHFDMYGAFNAPGPVQLKVYRDIQERDREIPVPFTGMVVYVNNLGMQVFGEKEWNTIPGTEK